MRNNYLYLFLVFTLLFGVSSCNDDDPTPIPQVTVSVTLNAPDSVSNAVVSNVVATLKNITTGRASEIDVIPAETGASTSFNFTLTVEEGLYNMTLEGDITYAFHDQQITSKIRGYKGNVELTGTNPSISLEGFLHNNTVGEKGNFVLAEIFFTGTETPEKKQYTGDKYFRIYNNSSDTLYADRLMIAESEFTTVKKYNYDPDIMKDAFAAGAIYVVPGTGKDYPVLPGKSILIVDNAINHTEANPSSFDLTKADFEWYDESTNPNFMDVNNPDVPDMDKYYCYTTTIWGPHNRGFKSYVLARVPEGVNKDSYLRNYPYHYEYEMVLPAGTFPMEGDCYKIPNEWVLDAVNCSIESNFVWLVTAPSLDLGWTYCGSGDQDASRCGKSVRRKVASTTADGIVLLQDTNNSAADFEAEAKADPFYIFK